MVIEDHLEMARGWLESARPAVATDSFVILRGKAMMLIHPPVNPYSAASEIRSWIEILERWRTEPIDDPEDLWFIDGHLSDAREWLSGAEEKEHSSVAAPPE